MFLFQMKSCRRRIDRATLLVAQAPGCLSRDQRRMRNPADRPPWFGRHRHDVRCRASGIESDSCISPVPQNGRRPRGTLVPFVRLGSRSFFRCVVIEGFACSRGPFHRPRSLSGAITREPNSSVSFLGAWNRNCCISGHQPRGSCEPAEPKPYCGCAPSRAGMSANATLDYSHLRAEHSR